MRPDYKAWLEANEYAPNTVSTKHSEASRLEQLYGDLETHYREDRLEFVENSLRFSKDDARHGVQNPSKLTINGDLYNALSSYRTAVGLYRRFLDSLDAPSQMLAVAATPMTAETARERIGLERDLQKALRREIEQLETGLAIIDGGAERSVASGYIDITAQDQSGAIVVIELKAGTGDRTAIGQILGYMGDLSEEEKGSAVRGILIAHDFDQRAKSAAKMVPSLSLQTYSVRFTFDDPFRAG